MLGTFLLLKKCKRKKRSKIANQRKTGRDERETKGSVRAGHQTICRRLGMRKADLSRHRTRDAQSRRQLEGERNPGRIFTSRTGSLQTASVSKEKQNKKRCMKPPSFSGKDALLSHRWYALPMQKIQLRRADDTDVPCRRCDLA